MQLRYALLGVFGCLYLILVTTVIYQLFFKSDPSGLPRGNLTTNNTTSGPQVQVNSTEDGPDYTFISESGTICDIPYDVPESREWLETYVSFDTKI